MSVYKGFNTIDRDYGPYHLRDNSLVLRDFLNHLYIRKGEKLMNPDFGTIIWQSLYEPMTPGLQETIRQDIENLVAYDPRIKEVGRVVVDTYENGLRIDIQISFSSNDEVANLALQFDQNTQTISAV